MMHAPPDVTALGARYLGTYLLGTPLIYGFFAIDAAFRASGDTRTPFVLLLASVGVTLVLDPVLILGLGTVSDARHRRCGDRDDRHAGRRVRSSGSTIVGAARRAASSGVPTATRSLRVLRIGLPTAVTGVMFTLIYVLLTRTTTQFGTPALAALGIGHRVESWLFMIGVGFGAATAAIVGQNLGAGRADRAARAGWMVRPASARCSVCVAFVAGARHSRAVRVVFTSDPAVIAEAAKYLRIAAISQLGDLRRDRARGRARRGGGDGAADAHVDGDHGVADSARRRGRRPLGERWALVDHLDHGDAARGRDDGPLARGTLEADLIV